MIGYRQQMAIIYTHNTSGAIRRLKRRRPTKEYLIALAKHIKYLKRLGLKVNDKGRIVMKQNPKYTTVTYNEISKDSTKRLDAEYWINKKFSGGTKPVNNWRLEESKNFTIAPAYNKGAYQVITKSNVKDIGKQCDILSHLLFY